MNGITPIKISSDSDRVTVSARELHDALQIQTDYPHWFDRMTEYGFVEGEDFQTFLTESTGGRPGKDAQITIEMAKQICMIQRTDWYTPHSRRASIRNGKRHTAPRSGSSRIQTGGTK